MPGDADLIRIVDSALAQAALNSGEWLVCRPGCCECCIGPFAITALDAARLRRGLTDLEAREPQRAARVRSRAARSIARMIAQYPVDTLQRVLAEDQAIEDEPCPALDPEAGTCDLYQARPVTCRTFGPAVRLRGEAAGICELCYQGASDEEIAACAVEVDPENVEAELLRQSGGEGETLVAFAICGGGPADPAGTRAPR
jgi:Fe-S-cluster containining protein